MMRARCVMTSLSKVLNYARIYATIYAIARGFRDTERRAEGLPGAGASYGR
jgi:hypothetical protein